MVAPVERLLSPTDVPGYLVGRELFRDAGGLEVIALPGGVSCSVFAVRGEGRRVVLKQALPRFRVADEWLAPPERAVAEAQAIELMARLAPGSVPPLLDSDPEACALVVEEAPASWRSWKAHLLEGNAAREVAARLGELLALLHGSTTNVEIGTVESFEAQRIDPYLRTIQRRHPELAVEIEGYLERLLATPHCLAHGDFSPKNVLVGDGGLWVVDWEVVHRGDPAFDLAFMLNHLLLKTIHRPEARAAFESCGDAFLDAYAEPVDLPYVLGLVGCLMLARVDGKSPAEYLTETEREHARGRGIALLTEPPSELGEAWEAVTPSPRG
jgi:5-methylthioribose kinase